MASWVLVPCLTSLRNEFNLLAPDRDLASDGSIGDTDHAASSSDHNPDETGNTPYEDADNINEVHAIDVDDDLRKPGWTMQRCVNIITTRHREGEDNRLQNVIYNRRIWSRSWGWTPQPYTGRNAHTEHAHFSARYTTAQENDTRPWGLITVPQQQKHWEYESVNGMVVPILRFSADDRDFAAYNEVERVQRQLSIPDDGVFGNQTKEALKRWFPSEGCDVVTKEMYCALMGIFWDPS